MPPRCRRQSFCPARPLGLARELPGPGRTLLQAPRRGLGEEHLHGLRLRDACRHTGFRGAETGREQRGGVEHRVRVRSGLVEAERADGHPGRGIEGGRETPGRLEKTPWVASGLPGDRLPRLRRFAERPEGEPEERRDVRGLERDHHLGPLEPRRRGRAARLEPTEACGAELALERPARPRIPRIGVHGHDFDGRSHREVQGAPRGERFDRSAARVGAQSPSEARERRSVDERRPGPALDEAGRRGAPRCATDDEKGGRAGGKAGPISVAGSRRRIRETEEVRSQPDAPGPARQLPHQRFGRSPGLGRPKCRSDDRGPCRLQFRREGRPNRIPQRDRVLSRDSRSAEPGRNRRDEKSRRSGPPLGHRGASERGTCAATALRADSRDVAERDAETVEPEKRREAGEPRKEPRSLLGREVARERLRRRRLRGEDEPVPVRKRRRELGEKRVQKREERSRSRREIRPRQRPAAP